MEGVGQETVRFYLGLACIYVHDVEVVLKDKQVFEADKQAFEASKQAFEASKQAFEAILIRFSFTHEYHDTRESERTREREESERKKSTHLISCTTSEQIERLRSWHRQRFTTDRQRFTTDEKHILSSASRESERTREREESERKKSTHLIPCTTSEQIERLRSWHRQRFTTDRQRFTTDEKHILSSASHPHPYHSHLIRFLFTHEYHDTRKSERARERENKTPRIGRYSDTEPAVEAFPRLAHVSCSRSASCAPYVYSVSLICKLRRTHQVLQPRMLSHRLT